MISLFQFDASSPSTSYSDSRDLYDLPSAFPSLRDHDIWSFLIYPHHASKLYSQASLRSFFIFLYSLYILFEKKNTAHTTSKEDVFSCLLFFP